MKRILAEFILPFILLVVLASLVWPYGFGGGHAMVMARQGILLSGFIVFALWIWREQSLDEREELHRMLIGRVAYLVGSGILIAGIVVQSLGGIVDRWLVYSLMGMVLVKVVGSVWARRRF